MATKTITPMLQGLSPRDGSVGALKWRFNGAAEEIRGRAGGSRWWRGCGGEECRRGGPERQGRLGKGDSLIVNSEGKDRKKKKKTGQSAGERFLQIHMTLNSEK